MNRDAILALPGGSAMLEREQTRARIEGDRWRQVHDLLGSRHISVKGQRQLTRMGLGPARLQADADKAADVTAAWDGVDTLRVLLVRIGFETNRDSTLTTVTNGGDFMLAPADTSDALPIDPSPHNKAFFEAHLNGLADFYRFQSGGRLHIESRVLPEGDTDSYKLADIADYGPGADGYWTIDGLERFVRDAIMAADQGTQADGSANLADYDDDNPFTYIIFAHAGSDWQSDVNQDSPNDIPTFFVTLGEDQPLTSIDSHTGAVGALTECSVIPETTTQDGYKGSIAAALYHEFGHALGLVDVYDTTTGLPSVGVWDLMDSGTNLAANLATDANHDGEITDDEVFSVTGVLPPSLGAWNKWFLGWAEVGTLTGAEETVKLPAVGVPRAEYHRYATTSGDFSEEYPQLLEAGASPREFFLIENRWVPLDEQDTPFDNYDPQTGAGGLFFVRDEATGVVLYLGGELHGVQQNTGLYDYFLPEGGLLVWHVNMDRIEPNLASNTINWHADGLKLVEADGIQDIGVVDAYVLGWYGSSRDPFTPYNLIGSLSLEVADRPSSRAYDRSYTGVHLWNIADDGDSHGAVMRFQAAVEPVVGAFPYELPPRIDAGDTLRARALDLTSLTPLNDHLFLADAPPLGETATLFALDRSGQPAFPVETTLPVGAVATLDGALAGPPATTTLTDLDAFVAVTVHGTVTAWRVNDTADGVQAMWSTAVADTALAGAIPVDLNGQTRLLCPLSPTHVALLGSDGNPVGDTAVLVGPGGMSPSTFVAPPRVWRRDTDAVLLCFTPDGWYAVTAEELGFSGDPVFHAYAEGTQDTVWPALVATTTGAELVVFGSGGDLGAWALTGNQVAPAPWHGAVSEPLVGEPAVADLDGDGDDDIVAATPLRVFAWQADGTVLTGFPAVLLNLFPLADSTQVRGTLVVADITGDGSDEVVFTTNEGHLLALDARGELLDHLPFRSGDESEPILALGDGPGGDVRTIYMLNRGGYTGPPHDRLLGNGRIVGYGVPGASSQGTSEWLGVGGGPARTGTMGTARDLGGISPADAYRDAVVYYPNPVKGPEVTVRFSSGSSREAQLTIYNLQGEEVLHRAIPVSAGQVNEATVPFDVASGMYVCRLEREGPAGWTRTVTTLAVER